MKKLFLCLISLGYACNSLAQDLPNPFAPKGQRFANAAERILNDPNFAFDDAKVQQAVAADVRKLDRERQAEIRKAAAKGSKGTKTVAASRPKKSYNRPRQIPAIEAYQLAFARDAYLRASQPRMYIGPVIWKR